MAIEDKVRVQTAVYWARSIDSGGNYELDDYGQPLFDDPIEILVRWDDTVEQFVDSKGETVTSRSIVMVGEDMKEGAFLKLGSLTDLTDESNPKNNDGAWEIKRFDKTPFFGSTTRFVREAYL